MDTLDLTERQLAEIKLAMLYAQECKHGTAGHNRLILIDKLAKYAGFVLDTTSPVSLKAGDNIKIIALTIE